jgi:hypothetical protein
MMLFLARYPVRRMLLVVCLSVCSGVGLTACSLTSSVEEAVGGVAPSLRVTTQASPSVLPAGLGKKGRYSIIIENVGGASTEGEITLKDVLPSRFTTYLAVHVEPEYGPHGEPAVCHGTTGEIKCGIPGPLVPGGFAVVTIYVEVTGSTGSLANVASVSGGNSQAATSETSIHEAGEAGAVEAGTPGVSQFKFEATGPAGEPYVQAGGHPQFLTTSLLLNNMYNEKSSGEAVKPLQDVKDLAFYLPLGLLGDAVVTEPCPVSLVEVKYEVSGCPPSSRIGTILPMILSTVNADSPDPTHEYGIYNVTPEKGFAAEFAFSELSITFFVYATVVHHDGQYMIRVATPGLPPGSHLYGLIASFDGDLSEHYLVGGEEFTLDRGAFMTTPSDCEESAEARQATVAANTWENPSAELPITKSVTAFPVLEGCEKLQFSPRVSVKPETTQADEPSGYEVGLEVPQAPNGGLGLGTPPVKNVSLTLPLGTTISPSSAHGLLACQETGPEGININGPESEFVGVDGLEHVAAGHCPEASQIATVTASTPLLHEELSGHLFLASPNCGGAGQAACTEADAKNGELFRLYLEMEAPGSGVVIKLEGTASVEPGTGQITAVFDEGPQFPFSELSVAMKRGPRAPLANPQTCGEAASSSLVSPWSEPQTAAVRSSSAFTVDWNGAGGPCPAASPFAPGFAAGTTSPTAGATSPFTLTVKREDREQNIQSLSTSLPEGLLADVAKVTKCPEPQASQDSLEACPSSSQIGTTTVSVGSGSEPYFVTGKVFFTGPYNGAPFGLSVVVPAVAGPFNLGDVLVRVALYVDPHTSQVTALSGPLPQQLDGVPLRIRTLNVTLTNPEFVLNPTSCTELSITAAIHSTTGTTTNTTTPYSAEGCKHLAFAPVVSGSTDARSTKADGTGVDVKISYPSTSGQADVSKVVLGFPSQLPVRLSTLQQACRAVVFEANPAGCPAGSNIGTATVHTPILSQPLAGPAYLVSYGSAKFPDVVFVLQGEGVRLDVDGHSFVSDKGVLKVTFESVPDAPFSSFETVLPAGPYSQFTASKSSTQAVSSQCGEELLAPATMTAYNGLQVTQNAKLQVTGCKPAVSLLKAKATASNIAVTVKTTVAGQLEITGPGLKTLTKKNVAAGTHKLTLTLTSAGKKAARAHKKIQITVRLTAGKQKASGHKKVAL